MSAADLISARIRREGSITFDAFMDLALYDPDHGFFARGHGAGRAGRDFVTSPEVGPLFGVCVAAAIDRTWESLGSPDPVLVVEAGAGNGRLGREILRAAPRCLGALRYALVERSAALRSRQRDLLPIEPADEALGPFVLRGTDEELMPVHAAGPVFASLAELPEMPVDAIVLANELFDNLPFGVAAWDGERWNEVRVTIDGRRFVELLVPAAASDAAMLGSLRADDREPLPFGTRVPLPRGLEAWLGECSRLLHTGVVTVIDYIADHDDFVVRGRDWLRTYRGQSRASDALDAPGTQDITGDVMREQLAHIARTNGFTIVDDRSQADWLHDLGIEDLVADGERAWDTGTARGGLDAIAGRSRATEAAALIDPAGLGAHRVVTMVKAAGPAGGRHR